MMAEDLSTHASYRHFVVQIEYLCPLCGHLETQWLDSEDVYALEEYMRSYGKCKECDSDTVFFIYPPMETRGELNTCRNVADPHKGGADIFKCSQCGYSYSDIYWDEDRYSCYPNFCPNCGSKVVGE